MFDDALEIALKISVGGETFTVPGGNVKNLTVNLRSWGFSAKISFWVSLEIEQDKLFSYFITNELIEVRLKIEPHFKPADGSKNAEMEPLELQGLVMDKAILKELTIENVHLKGDRLLYRHYQVRIADPARVLWSQHYPCDILVDTSVKELIEANKATGVTLLYDWPELEEEFAINTLSLGAANHKASFYDFLLWYTAANNGVFIYNTQTNEYTLTKGKDESGERIVMSELEITSYQIKFPASIRYNDRLLNCYSEEPEIKQTDRTEAQEGVHRDTLLRQPIMADFEKTLDLETEKQKSRGHEIQLTHARFPLLTYRPGILLALEGGLWSDKIFIHSQKYRLRNMVIRARAVNEEADSDHNMPYSRYRIDMRSRLELQDEAALNLPVFETPDYPILVEGRIVSEIGGEGDETYQVYQHPQTGLDQYRVSLPLFDNQQVVVPFEPVFSSGHFYFPAYKDARVLLAFDFHTARIVSFLDWRPDCRLPLESQGNHLLLGINSDSITSINHIYVDGKPQMNMKRTSDTDTQIIQFHEGRIVLETKEED